MALFNSKEAEKNPKPQTPVQTGPTSTPAPSEDRGHAAKSASPSSAPAAPSSGHAYFDHGTRINGKVAFEGPARIDGHVEGEVSGKDTITIGEGAVVTAQIRATSVVVAGKVNGDVIATNRIEIRPSAKVLGNLSAPVLVVHEGALFEGRCSMRPEGTRENKVTVLPKEERSLQQPQGLAQVGGLKQA